LLHRMKVMASSKQQKKDKTDGNLEEEGKKYNVNVENLLVQ
jgi:hypothetical protein